jgi:hypothetical protein
MRIAGRLITDSVADLKVRQQDVLAAEGYQFYAQEAEEFAEASWSAVSEALTHGGLTRQDLPLVT